MSYDDGTCPICRNFRYECVCPKDIASEEVMIPTKRKSTLVSPVTPILKPEGQMSFTTEDADFIKMYEEKYPETTGEFKRIAAELYVIWCRKNHNYGMSNISLGTDLSTEEDRKVSLSGIFFRSLDKIQRIKQLLILGTQDKVGESIMDSFQDLTVYSIIAQIVANGKWGK